MISYIRSVSADNGIYILESFTKEGGEEYRVIHAQAIENLYWWDDLGPPVVGSTSRDLCPQRLIEYFGKSKVYNAKDASKKAEELYDNIMNGDGGGIVEYGICTIKYDAVFPGQIDLV